MTRKDKLQLITFLIITIGLLLIVLITITGVCE